MNDIVQTFVNFARILFGISGSAVLVFFVYGGFVWLTSGGSADRIKKGRDIIVNSVIGLAIVFGAATIVKLVYSSFGATTQVQIGQACSKGEGKSAKQGVYELPRGANADSPPECVTSCADEILKKAGYAAMNPADGVNCIVGISEGAKVCCQPKPKPAP